MDILYTKEQVEELSKNPYVKSATPWRVYFTQEFKDILFDGIMNGIPIEKIMREYGINPEIFGKSTLTGMKRSMIYRERHINVSEALQKSVEPKNSRNDPYAPKDEGQDLRTLNERISDLEKEVKDLKDLLNSIE